MISIINSLAEYWWYYYSLMQIQNTLFALTIIGGFFLLRKQIQPFINFISMVVILKFAIPPFIKATVESLPSNFIKANTILIPTGNPLIENPSFSIISVLFSIWLFLVILFISIVIRKSFSLKIIAEHSQLLKHIHLKQKKIPVLISTDISEPLVLGFVRYKIILPKWVLDTNDTQQKLILQHELAHIYFKDNRLKLLEILFTLIYLPNPIVLFLFKKIAYFRELRSDEWAIQKLGYSRKSLADELVYFAEKIKEATPFISPAIGFWQNRSSFFRRIQFHLVRKESSMFYYRFIQYFTLISLISFFTVFSSDITQSENTKIFKFSEVDKKPKILKMIRPDYPELAKKNRIEGRVTVKITIDEKGVVEKAEILKSIPELDEVVLESAKKYTFEPAENDGKPVKISMILPISFALDELQKSGQKELLKQAEETGIYSVTLVDEKPRILKEVKPSFMAIDKRNYVAVNIIIDEAGNVEKVEIIESVPEFDQEALEAAKQFKFTPAKKDGKAVKVSFPVIF